MSKAVMTAYKSFCGLIFSLTLSRSKKSEIAEFAGSICLRVCQTIFQICTSFHSLYQLVRHLVLSDFLILPLLRVLIFCHVLRCILIITDNIKYCMCAYFSFVNPLSSLCKSFVHIFFLIRVIVIVLSY